MYRREGQYSISLLFYSSFSFNSSLFSSFSFAKSGNSCSTSTSSTSSVSSSSLSSLFSDVHWSSCISSILSISSSTSSWRSLPCLLRAYVMAFRSASNTSANSTILSLLSSNNFFGLFKPLGPALGSSTSTHLCFLSGFSSLSHLHLAFAS